MQTARTSLHGQVRQTVLHLATRSRDRSSVLRLDATDTRCSLCASTHEHQLQFRRPRDQHNQAVSSRRRRPATRRTPDRWTKRPARPIDRTRAQCEPGCARFPGRHLMRQRSRHQRLQTCVCRLCTGPPRSAKPHAKKPPDASNEPATIAQVPLPSGTIPNLMRATEIRGGHFLLPPQWIAPAQWSAASGSGLGARLLPSQLTTRSCAYARNSCKRIIRHAGVSPCALNPRH